MDSSGRVVGRDEDRFVGRDTLPRVHVGNDDPLLNPLRGGEGRMIASVAATQPHRKVGKRSPTIGMIENNMKNEL
jgi:hypothetical protein